MEIKSITAAQIFTEEKFTKRILFQDEASTVFALNFMPGQSLPTHKHPETLVYIVVIQGGGTVHVDGKETEVLIHDVIHVEGSEEFSFKNTGNELTSLYVSLTKKLQG
jgi:quercetin dioxygenase-like cupin family protein